MRKHSQWPLVKEILIKLNDKGFKAYIAGGAVRDLLLGKEPGDIDIATSAPPEFSEENFAKTLNVGKAFGTVIVVDKGFQVEVTTFRKDGPYKDGRHPSYVEFSDEKEDAARRDFTINSMFLEPFSEIIIDFFNGQKDLENKIIRTVGEPKLRFKEDKLRMLRAFRFASQLDYKIDENTYQAISEMVCSIYHVSKERVINELEKMSLGCASCRSWHEFLKSGLWSALNEIKREIELPKSSDFEEFGANDLLSYYAFLTYWHNEYRQLDLLRKVGDWPFSKKFKTQLTKVMQSYFVLNSDSAFFKKALAFDSPQGTLALDLWKFDVVKNRRQTQDLDDFIQLFLIISDKSGQLPRPLLQGNDLMALGMKPSPEFQKVLEKAYELQVMNKINSKDRLIKIIANEV